MKPRVVWSPKYEVDYGEHSFATRKFRVAAESLAGKADLVEPEEPSREDLLLAHDARWVDKLYEGKLDPGEEKRLELPFSPAISLAHRLAASGTVLAARHALETGVGLHAGGGAHHAMRAWGEGYCAVNDLAVAALKLRAEGEAPRVAVVDLDVHQGNGTAAILGMDPAFFTFSMHQYGIYPEVRKPSSLDVELLPGTGDAEYYDKLMHGLRRVVDFRPALVLYQAGVDVHEKDKLGGLKLTDRGILDRDNAVREVFRTAGVPVAVTLGGGYGPTPEATGALHAATLKLFAGLELVE